MKNFIFILAPAAILLSSCIQKEYTEWNKPWDASDEGFSHEMIVLGEQLQDPYSVENITKALESIYPASAGRTGIQPTDFYVRFLPRDDSQMQQLTDLGLELTDHPLDYRIVREGDWYHDPTVPEGSITWQYGVVPVDFEFPRDIRYERLDDCYLADNDPSTRADGIDWQAVEREAYRLTGNLPSGTRASDASGGGTPQGTITILDPDGSPEAIGVKGVKVCCNSFVKFATCYTDEDGSFRMDRSFASDVRYRLVFKNIKGFSQGVNLVLIPASVSTFGTQPAAGFDATVDSRSDRKLFLRCVVNNAGYDYIESAKKSLGAIPAPPRDFRLWTFDALDCELPTMIHHGVLLDTFEALDDMPSVYSALIKLVQPDALVGYMGCESYAEVYAKALHIFAHGGHFSQVGKDWWWNYLKFAVTSLIASTLTTTYGVSSDEWSGWGEVAETYAFYCQSVLYANRYPDSKAVFGSTEWFSPQLLMYLDDRGLGLDKLAGLFTDDVCDMDDLRDKLLSYYPPFKSIINEAYARYR
mgnify:CR=1 FL=1